MNTEDIVSTIIVEGICTQQPRGDKYYDLHLQDEEVRLCCVLKIYSRMPVFIKHLLHSGQCAKCLTHRILMLLIILRSKYYRYHHLTDKEPSKIREAK